MTTREQRAAIVAALDERLLEGRVRPCTPPEPAVVRELCSEVDALEKENERLRRAAKSAIEAWYDDATFKDYDGPVGGSMFALQQALDAREQPKETT